MDTPTFEHGHGFLPPEVKKLLYLCKAKQEGRYAIHGVCVETDALVTTNGIQLLRLEVLHTIPPGNWCCSQDGYLLYPMERPFVPYKDLLPPEENLVKLWRVAIGDKSCLAHSVHLINLAGCFFDLEPFVSVAKVLSRLAASEVNVFVSKDYTSTRGFILEGSLAFARKFKYLQAPVIPTF